MSKKTHLSIGPRATLPVAKGGGGNNAHSTMIGWQKAPRIDIQPKAKQNNRQKTNLFMTQITGPLLPPEPSSNQHRLTRDQQRHYDEWNASMEEKEYRVMPAGTASAHLSPSFVKITKEWRREPTQTWRARRSGALSARSSVASANGTEEGEYAATGTDAIPGAEDGDGHGRGNDIDGGEDEQQGAAASAASGNRIGEGGADPAKGTDDPLAATQISILSAPEPKMVFKINVEDISRGYLEESMRSHRMVKVKETPRPKGLVPSEEKHFGRYDCETVYRAKVLPYAWEKRTTGPKWTKLSKSAKKMGIKVQGEGFKDWVRMKDEAERRLHGQFASFTWIERDPNYKFPIQLSPRGKGREKLVKIKPIKNHGEWVHPIVTPRSRYNNSVNAIEHMYHQRKAREASERELKETIAWAHEEEMSFKTQGSALAATEDYRRQRLVELANTLQTFDFNAEDSNGAGETAGGSQAAAVHD